MLLFLLISSGFSSSLLFLLLVALFHQNSVVTMHFIFAIVVLLPVVLGVSLSEDLRIFSDSSANFFPVDTPTDSATSYLDNNNDDNLFADLPGPMDISSSEDGLDFLASDPSCLSSQQGQPSAKLRRQHADCAPNIQSSSSIDGLINTLGIFDSGSISETATGEESKLATTFPNVDVGTPCPGQFLGHLCCEYGGEIISQVNIVGTSLNVYSTMTNCDSGMFCWLRPFDT